MCSVFKVSRGGFYKWTMPIPSKRSIENQLIEAEVQQSFENSKKIYGSPRITLELNKKNIKYNREAIAVEVGHSMPAIRVTGLLERIIREQGKPKKP